jgi:P27 family predicted phage terminase small subunit
MSRRPRPNWLPNGSAHDEPAPSKPPAAPRGLGSEGKRAWKWVLGHYWITVDRHHYIVLNYCRIQDLLDLLRAQVEADGAMISGSQGQARMHPAWAEIRALTTEARLHLAELGLSPASQSKVGVAGVQAPSALEQTIRDRRDQTARAQRRDTDHDDDGRVSLIEQARRRRNSGKSGGARTF